MPRSLAEIRKDHEDQVGLTERTAFFHEDLGIVLAAWDELALRLQQADMANIPAAGAVRATSDMTLGEVLDALMDGEGGQGHV